MIGRGVALAYHGIERVAAGDDPRRLCLAPERLERQVRLLQRAGYRFVTGEQVLAEGELRPQTAALTFDDGFRNWLTAALPLLLRLGVPATFYLCPGWWDARHPLVRGEAGRLLSADEARALHEAGMELGSHTLSHPDLTRLGDAALACQLIESAAAIEELTGRPCRTLAYPYGLADARVQQAAADAGYTLAWTWLPGPWRPLAAPRLPAPPRHGAGRLALKLLGVRRRGR